eukprot:748421-Hanusia_phi.AAC.5
MSEKTCRAKRNNVHFVVTEDVNFPHHPTELLEVCDPFLRGNKLFPLPARLPLSFLPPSSPPLTPLTFFLPSPSSPIFSLPPSPSLFLLSSILPSFLTPCCSTHRDIEDRSP